MLLCCNVSDVKFVVFGVLFSFNPFELVPLDKGTGLQGSAPHAVSVDAQHHYQSLPYLG